MLGLIVILNSIIRINQIYFTTEKLSTFRDKDLWIYTSEEELIELEEMGWVKEKISYLHFPTSKIGLSFFIPEKRKKMVAKKYLIKI